MEALRRHRRPLLRGGRGRLPSSLGSLLRGGAGPGGEALAVAARAGPVRRLCLQTGMQRGQVRVQWP